MASVCCSIFQCHSNFTKRDATIWIMEGRNDKRYYSERQNSGPPNSGPNGNSVPQNFQILGWFRNFDEGLKIRR